MLLAKTKLLVAVLVVLVGAAAGLKADEMRSVDQAVDQAAKQIVESLKIAEKQHPEKLGEIKNIAVMPLWGLDLDSYVAETVKSYLAGSRYAVMARDTAEWDQLLGEIKWNTLREDIMNPQTVQTFGKIEGCDAIVYGTVRQRQVDQWAFTAVVRLTLHLADVETGQIVWSSTPVTSSVWLEWGDILKLAIRHPVIWVIGGIIVLLIILRTLRGIFIIGTRGR
jgi:TolB-like protein